MGPPKPWKTMFYGERFLKPRKQAMVKEINFSVAMSCQGCANAVTRVLGKIDGVEEVTCDVEKKDVKVFYGDNVSSQVLLDALLKWGNAAGKAVSLKPE